jgi:hypothetical protein
MLQFIVNKHNTNWHHMFFSALWAYRTTIKTSTNFTPFLLIHGIESTLPIDLEIPMLHTSIELLPGTAPMEQCLLTLELLDEDHWSSLHNNEVAKNGPNSPLTGISTYIHLTKEILSEPMISPTMLWFMGNWNHYGMDPTIITLICTRHTCLTSGHLICLLSQASNEQLFLKAPFLKAQMPCSTTAHVYTLADPL